MKKCDCARSQIRHALVLRPSTFNGSAVVCLTLLPRVQPADFVSYECNTPTLYLTAARDFISPEGKNYYFWETTATGWQLGTQLPNTCDVGYWGIALAIEIEL